MLWEAFPLDPIVGLAMELLGPQDTLDLIVAIRIGIGPRHSARSARGWSEVLHINDFVNTSRETKEIDFIGGWAKDFLYFERASHLCRCFGSAQMRLLIFEQLRVNVDSLSHGKDRPRGIIRQCSVVQSLHCLQLSWVRLVCIRVVFLNPTFGLVSLCVCHLLTDAF